MSRDLTTLSDKLELTELVARIAQAVDRHDEAAIASCYSEKSFDDHGRFKGSGAEFAAFICGPAMSAISPFTHHLMGQSLFDIDGDEAFGETYFAFWMQTSPDTLIQSIGRYLDFFEKTDGEWKVTYRRVAVSWDGTVSSQNAQPMGQLRGSRDATDPLYQRLKWPVDEGQPA